MRFVCSIVWKNGDDHVMFIGLVCKFKNYSSFTNKVYRKPHSILGRVTHLSVM